MKYTCDKCKKEFNKKSNYNYHIGRKRPCIEILNNIDDDIQISKNVPPNSLHFGGTTLQNTSTAEEILSLLISNTNILENNTSKLTKANKYKCEQCNTGFTRKDNYVRHIKERCKTKKYTYVEIEKLENTLSEQNILINNLFDKIKNMENNKFISEQDQILTNNIVSKAKNKKEKFNSVIENANTTNITNNKVSNSNNTTNNIIFNGTVNFGYESTDKLKEEEILSVLKSKSNAFPKFIKLMHINENLLYFHHLSSFR
jgi:transposase-like protein